MLAYIDRIHYLSKLIGKPIIALRTLEENLQPKWFYYLLAEHKMYCPSNHIHEHTIKGRLINKIVEDHLSVSDVVILQNVELITEVEFQFPSTLIWVKVK